MFIKFFSDLIYFALYWMTNKIVMSVKLWGHQAQNLRTLEIPHRRHPLSCCHGDGNCDPSPHHHPPPSRPVYEESSVRCWVESENYVPDPSPPSIWRETHWASASVVSLYASISKHLLDKWNKLLTSSLTLSLSRSSRICWCSCSVRSGSPSWSYLAKMAWISASVWPFLSKERNKNIENQLYDSNIEQIKHNGKKFRAFSTILSFSHPLRSWRSSSKFIFPPACRKLSEMSSTAVFFSLSFIKALLQPCGKEIKEIHPTSLSIWSHLTSFYKIIKYFPYFHSVKITKKGIVPKYEHWTPGPVLILY